MNLDGPCFLCKKLSMHKNPFLEMGEVGTLQDDVRIAKKSSQLTFSLDNNFSKGSNSLTLQVKLKK